MTKRLSHILAWTVGAACVFPFAVLALLSVVERWPFTSAWPTAWAPERWAEVLAGGAVLRSFVVSVIVSTAVAAVSTAGGFVTGRFVSRHPRGRAMLLMAYLPFALSPVILGVCLLYLYLRLGLVGTLPGVVLAQTIFAFGFAIVFFSAFWNPRMRAFEGLVRTLGGSPWQVFREALLPLARGAIALCFFQTFLLSWFQYGLTLLIGAGRVQTLPVTVFAYVNEANPGYAALASCVLVLPPLLLLWINRRFLFAPDMEDAPAIAHL